MTRLRTLDVLVLDAQATGATPVLGELLELGWSVASGEATKTPTRAFWMRLSEGRRVSMPVRKLTGWDESCLDGAIAAADAWQLLLTDADAPVVPTVIHYARFELPFLRALHGDASTFPLDPICLHAIAARLFPELPRRNLRAVSGSLGFSPELVRRARGHVDATAFVWRALIPRLEELGVDTWDDLKHWLESVPSKRPSRRGFPLSVERRRAVPDVPGVYRFLRPNGDVLYVGKATSLKKRIASHFNVATRATERALEMLSQVHDLSVEATGSALEAALLETDEIKRLDPPYNIQLRAGARSAWFASRDWTTTRPGPDEEHRVGPLPSPNALAGIAAMRRLLEGEPSSEAVRAAAVGSARFDAPDEALFSEVWPAFAAEHLGGSGSARTRILRASERIVPTESDEETIGWDAPRVLRNLERTLVGEALLVRRARVLSLLSEARIAFREVNAKEARELFVMRGDLVAPFDPRRPPPTRMERLAAFDAARYDRMRVLATELRRVVDEGGEVLVRLRGHSMSRAGARHVAIRYPRRADP